MGCLLYFRTMTEVEFFGGDATVERRTIRSGAAKAETRGAAARRDGREREGASVDVRTLARSLERALKPAICYVQSVTRFWNDFSKINSDQTRPYFKLNFDMWMHLPFLHKPIIFVVSGPYL